MGSMVKLKKVFAGTVIVLCFAFSAVIAQSQKTQGSQEDSKNVVGSERTGQQNSAEPGKWNPTYLHRLVTDDEVKAYKKEFDIAMAATAYLYALPTYLHFKQRYEVLYNFKTYMGDKGNPFGQFLLLRQPTSPKTTDTLPNYDTLYGTAFLELKGHPMVLSVPHIPGRYYSFAMMDAYFYNFECIGSRVTGQDAGNYLIVGPNWQGQKPQGITNIIQSPTNSMHMYERIYFRNLDDVPVVNKIQDQIKLIPLETFLDPNAAVTMPDPEEYLKINPLLAKDPVRVFEIANKYMGENPPPAEDKTMLEYFAPIGVGPGFALPQDDYSKDILRNGAVAADHAMTALALSGFKIKNGWQIPPANVAKRGGPGGVANQAMLQLRSIGILIPDEAVYYVAYTDGNLQRLNGKKKYTLSFKNEDIPPFTKEKFGFWSVTMYDRVNTFLIDNPANKYIVRSGDDFVYGKDKSLTIYIQTEPPANEKLRVNWLPAPKEGDFILALRVYVGEEAVVSGKYIPPAVMLAE